MMLRFLVVSPMMADFAGSDAQTIPPGPGDLAGYLSCFDAEVVLIDWGRPERAEHGGEFAEMLRAAQPCDAVVISSGTACCSGIRKAVEVVREILGDIPVILRGDSAEHTGEHSCADLIFTGPVDALPFALRTFGFRMRRRRVRREK